MEISQLREQLSDTSNSTHATHSKPRSKRRVLTPPRSRPSTPPPKSRTPSAQSPNPSLQSRSHSPHDQLYADMIDTDGRISPPPPPYPPPPSPFPPSSLPGSTLQPVINIAPTNVPLVDRLIAQVAAFTNNLPLPPDPSTSRPNSLHSSMFANIPSEAAGLPADHGFGATYKTLRATLHTELSPTTPLTPPQMYHILTTAFLLMESERDTFQADLDSIDRHYKTRTPPGAGALALIIANKHHISHLTTAFNTWKTTVSVLTHSKTSTAASAALKTAILATRACAMLRRSLHYLTRTAFHAWQVHHVNARAERALTDAADKQSAYAARIAEGAADQAELSNQVESLIAQLAMTMTKSQQSTLRHLNKFIKTWQNVSLARTYKAWTYHTSLQKKHKSSLTLFLTRFRRSTLYKTLLAWRDHAATEKQSRHTLKKYLHRLQSLTYTRALNAWSDFVRIRKQARNVLKRMVARATDGALLSAFLSWSNVVRYTTTLLMQLDYSTAQMRQDFTAKLDITQQRKKQQALKMVQHLINSSLTTSLKSWRTFTAKCKADRVLLRRFATKWRHANLLYTFNAWLLFLSRRAFLRTTLSKISTNLQSHSIGHFFKLWQNKLLLFANQSLEEQRDAHQKNLLLSLSREDTLKSTIAQLTAAHDLILATLSTTQQQKQQDSLARALKFIKKWKDDALGGFFNKWRAAHKANRRTALVVTRAIQRIKNRELSRTITHWYTHTVEAKRNRLAIKRFQLRYNNLTLFRAFNQWTYFKQQRQRLKKLCYRYFFNKDASLLSAGWNKWINFIVEYNSHVKKQGEADHIANLFAAEQDRKVSRPPPRPLCTHTCVAHTRAPAAQAVAENSAVDYERMPRAAPHDVEGLRDFPEAPPPGRHPLPRPP